MKGFNKKVGNTVSIKPINVISPIVYVEGSALVKMQNYIDKCNDEVGWMGTVVEEDGKVIIKDVFLFDQEVHATTTEIHEEGLQKFASEILQQEGGVELWNSLKVWGHSHVRMAVSPSGQDDAQMEFFAQCGHDYFIRIIGNKNNAIKFDFYDYRIGVAFLDVRWVEIPSEHSYEKTRQLILLENKLKMTTEKMNQQISEVKAEIEELDKSVYSLMEVEIQKEIDLKVKKKYTTQYQQTSIQMGTQQVGRMSTGTETVGTTSNVIKLANGEYIVKSAQTQLAEKKNISGLVSDAKIESVTDIESLFSAEDLMNMYGFAGFNETEQYIEHKYSNYFTLGDKRQIYDYCQNLDKYIQM